MALLDNSIGQHEFIALIGETMPPRTAKVLFDRPGIDGTESLIGGKKGPPFSLISTVDTEDRDAAIDLHLLYQELISQGPQELVQGGVSSVQKDWQVSVVDVVLIAARTIRGATGRKLNPPSQGLLICRWDLVGVPNPVP